MPSSRENSKWEKWFNDKLQITISNQAAFHLKWSANKFIVSLQHIKIHIYLSIDVLRLVPELSCWRWFAPGEGGPIAGCAGTAKTRDKLSVIHLGSGSRECGRKGVNAVVTFSMLLWCFCSLSRSVGRATLMNLWIVASRRLSVSLLPSSAMCPADCPQPTPRRNLDAAPARFYLTAPTDAVNTRRVWF